MDHDDPIGRNLAEEIIDLHFWGYSPEEIVETLTKCLPQLSDRLNIKLVVSILRRFE